MGAVMCNLICSLSQDGTLLRIIVHHTVDDPLDPDGGCVDGFVEHTLQRLVVSHDLKGSSIQEQVKFLAPKITC